MPLPTLSSDNAPVVLPVVSESTPENTAGLVLSLPTVNVAAVLLLFVTLPAPVSEPMLWL